MAYEKKYQDGLALRWQTNGDQDAASELHSSCLGILKSFAQKLSFTGDSEDDIISDFNTKFVQALNTWDSQRGTAFTSHLFNLVHHEFVSRIHYSKAVKRSNRSGYPASVVTVSLDAPIGDEYDYTVADTIADEKASPVESLVDVSLIAEQVSSDPVDQKLLTDVATGEIELYDLPSKHRARLLAALPSAKRLLQREYERDYRLPKKQSKKPVHRSRHGVWQVSKKLWAVKYCTKYLGCFSSESAALAAREQAQRERAERSEAELRQTANTDEEWRVIKQKPLYEVSSLGRIRNAKTLKVMKPWRCQKGYGYQIDLRGTPVFNQRNRFSVARLVAQAFFENFNDEDSARVFHKNSDRTDNRPCNLMLVHCVPKNN